MKKIMLTMAAIFVTGIATAQIDPNQPQQTQPDPVNAVDPDTKNTADPQVDVPIDSQTMEEQKSQNHDQPLKDELKTRDHVKSTPDPSVVKDKKDEDKQQTVKSKRKKRNRNN